jgi:hypothetical protein
MELAIARLQDALDAALKDESNYRKEVDWSYEALKRNEQTLEIQQAYVDELKRAIEKLKHEL